MGRRCKQVADDIAEEFCFVCKDGGDLRVCDFKNCLKAYHPHCVGKEDDFLSSNDQFTCDCHRCAICRRNSLYECFCCPSSSMCGDCLGKVEFVQLKENKGFCSRCLNMAIVTEKNADHEEARGVFAGTTENYEVLFKDYWEVIKGKDRFTLLDLQAASINLKRSLNCKEGKDSDEHQKTGGPSLGDSVDAGKTFLLDTTDKPIEVQTPLKRKKSNKKTYVDWASKELTDFLVRIGKYSTKPLDHYRVTGVVREYIQENLQDKKKKKSVECDENLRALFGNKKNLKNNMVHSLLETHLAVNAISEDESDEFEDDYASTVKKKPRNSLEPKILKKVSGINKTCLAALNQDNLNLIYLRRSLAVKLLSELDTFQQKVVGCLVRVKNDVKSYTYQMTRKHYQVGLVTGIKKSSEEYKIKGTDVLTDILLCVSNMCDDVKISMLSEENFEEDECNDLLLSAKKGLFKRPTVAEFEEKEASVHADIVNHWIDRELLRLEKDLGRAYEKGWRHEMHDLSCQKKLLSTPAERQRRLEVTPEVIPDEEDQSKVTESEAAASDPLQGNQGSRRNIAACLKDVEEISKEAAKQLPLSLKVIIDEPREEAAKQLPVSLKVIIDEPREDPEAAKQSPVSLKVIIDEPGEEAAKQLPISLKVILHEPREGVTQQVADPLEVGIDESPEGASLRHAAAFEAGSKALCNGGTACPEMYTSLDNCQDAGTTELINIDNGKDENSSRHPFGGDKEVINLDSDDDEDLHMEQRVPERSTRGAPEATNGITAQIHHAPEAVDRQYTHHAPEVSNGIAVHTCDAPEAVNGVTVPTVCASKNLDEITTPARGTSRAMTEVVAPSPIIVNGTTESEKMWHYVDPTGKEQGPLSMDQLRKWQKAGYFPEDFRVWRTGRKAIKLVDAMRMAF